MTTDEDGVTTISFSMLKANYTGVITTIRLDAQMAKAVGNGDPEARDILYYDITLSKSATAE